MTEGTELGQINEGLMELYDEQPEECVGFSIIVKHRRIEGLWLRAVITGYNAKTAKHKVAFENRQLLGWT